jgi:lipid-A-disaccharide synthase
MLPFLAKVAGDVRERLGDVRWLVAKSDFVSDDDLESYSTGREERVLEGESSRLLARVDPIDGSHRHAVLITERGVQIDVVTATDAMREADLAVTIPGTNTAELAALGIPMLLLLPTHRLHTLPLPGLPGHLGGVPVVGPAIKQLVAEIYLRTRRHWAHPNRRSGARLVPELVGKVTAAEVAGAVARALEAPLDSLGARLRETMGPPGGAGRLVDEVLATIDRRRGGR